MESNPELPTSAPSPATKPNIRTITPSERIQELNSIDASIASLLHSAGSAIRVLGSSNSSPSTADQDVDLATSKSQFLSSITSYFTTLSSVDVRLRRQVYALQEAGLIADGDARDAKRGASASASALTSAGGGTGAAGGELDMSWLDGRGERVEKDMEREVWRRAREFVEGLLDGRSEREANGLGEEVEMSADGRKENGRADGKVG